MPPKLIIIGGAPATGKSILADKIQAVTGYHRVSKDLLKEHLFDVIEYRDRQWSREIGALAFPLFMGVVEMYLKRGESVIVDNPFIHGQDLEWFEKFECLYQTQIIQIHLIADPAVLRERFVERAHTHRHPGHNDALEDVLQEFEEKWFNKSFIPLPIGTKTKIVDTTDFATVDHDEILKWTLL
ncbi:MAG: ATP-binding protein [Candidatus Uhrbacteria bacterium]|nr:ATP-binding protein [Candidatus Uhrbacteria bacterium]